MSKVAHYLQEHLLGEVTASPEVRRHFANDASIVRLAPAIVAYPRNESDVRKTARFSWQLAQRGRVVPITARGGGSDTSGAALGSGILLVFTAHMNKILTLDPRKEFVVVEPGVTYDKLEQTLYTHGLFLPPYPSSHHFATIGGSLANGAIGEKSVKYGRLLDYVQSLRVVLANGEIIETGPLSKRALSRKMGASTFEGEIYRSLDALLEENAQLVASARKHIKAPHNSAGYNIFDIKGKDGFDLTPLFVNSQGTLGIITEATLEVVAHNPITTMALVGLEELNDLHDVLPDILKLKPSVCDMINREAIKQVTRINPNQLSHLLPPKPAAIYLLLEFDDQKDAIQKKSLKKLHKIVEKIGGSFETATQPEEQDKFWKIRHSVTTILTQPIGQLKAVPVAEDVCVPVNSLVEYLHKATEIYNQYDLPAAAWGQAGMGVVRMQPLLDLGQLGDRQKLFRITDALYNAVVEMGGSLSASAGDGRVRSPYLSRLYGPEMYSLMLQVKKIFDPHNMLNPGVKTGNNADLKALMRGEYNLAHHHEHLPRS